jgi:predicted helicase
MTALPTLRDIPLAAYDYIVNGKPALEWVMERQSVTTDKASGITNDANLWATEAMGNAHYPFELFLRVITVRLETMKIVDGLPGLNIPAKAATFAKFSKKSTP